MNALELPPEIALENADPTGAFRVLRDTAFFWFEPGNAHLIVTFDNLATLDHPYPRLPWLHRPTKALGYSILGVQSHAKDWFRQETAPQMIADLQATGFFNGFQSISFIGASMGGFAALNFAPLVPGARVLALSPQSTMNRDIAPFDQRFGWAIRNSNWTRPAYLDAVDAVPSIRSVSLLYDPYTYEDNLHAHRLNAPNVQLIKLPYATHEAIRVVVKCGGVEPMIEEFAYTGRLGENFWFHMRRRRSVRKWARSFTNQVVKSNHPRLAIAATDLLYREQGYIFAKQARDEVRRQHPKLADQFRSN